MLSGDRTLSRQYFWVAIEMTIIQDSVATRTRTKMLSRQEKLGRDTNLKKQLSITIATKKTLSRHQLAEAALKLYCDMIIDIATQLFEECTEYCHDKGNFIATELSY